MTDGDLEHLLIVCPALDHVRHRLHSLWCMKTVDCPPLHIFILKILGSCPKQQVKFILDSAACPEIVDMMQKYGQEIINRVMYLTRTWAFSIHRSKMKLLGRWPGFTKSDTHDINDDDNHIDDILTTVSTISTTNGFVFSGDATLPQVNSAVLNSSVPTFNLSHDQLPASVLLPSSQLNCPVILPVDTNGEEAVSRGGQEGEQVELGYLQGSCTGFQQPNADFQSFTTLYQLHNHQEGASSCVANLERSVT